MPTHIPNHGGERYKDPVPHLLYAGVPLLSPSIRSAQAKKKSKKSSNISKLSSVHTVSNMSLATTTERERPAQPWLPSLAQTTHAPLQAGQLTTTTTETNPTHIKTHKRPSHVPNPSHIPKTVLRAPAYSSHPYIANLTSHSINPTQVCMYLASTRKYSTRFLPAGLPQAAESGYSILLVAQSLGVVLAHASQSGSDSWKNECLILI